MLDNSREILLDASIHDIGLPPDVATRIENAYGVTDVRELLKLRKGELLAIKGITQRSYDAIITALSAYGFGPKKSTLSEEQILANIAKINDRFKFTNHPKFLPYETRRYTNASSRKED
jgi:DNA-directed RNA polymerase alpha subunit